MKRQGVKVLSRGPITQAGREGERGFTLLETMIALVILLVVCVGIMGLFFYSMRNNLGASDRELSLAVAQQRMEQLRSLTFTDANLTSDSTQTVTVANRSYSVSTTICTTSTCGASSSLKLITVTVTPLNSTTAWGSTPVTIAVYRASTSVGQYIQ